MTDSTVTQPDGELVGHTPGPWTVDRLAVNGEVVVRAGDEVAYICMVFCRNKEQDARLIAAAPALAAENASLKVVCAELGNALRDDVSFLKEYQRSNARWFNDSPTFNRVQELEVILNRAKDAGVVT